MYKKLVCLGVIFVMCFSFSACGEKKLPYNAIIVSNGSVEELIPKIGYFKESFWKENMTLGAFYKNDNWDPKDSDSEEYLCDETSPSFRLHTIKNQEQYNDIFVNTQQIDFNNNMMFVYIFTAATHRAQKLKDIRMDNNILKIEFVTNKAKTGYNDATLPMRRFIVVKMDNFDITNVEFIHVK